jgi:hypothetical protein
MSSTNLNHHPLLSRILYLGSVTAGIVMLAVSTLLLLVIALSDPLQSTADNDAASTRISIEIPEIPPQDAPRQALMQKQSSAAPT